jgi:hypothetical protein
MPRTHFIELWEISRRMPLTMDRVGETKVTEVNCCESCPFFDSGYDYDDPSCSMLLKRVKNKWRSHYLRGDREHTVDKKCPLKNTPITVMLKS